MSLTSLDDRQRIQKLDRAALSELQLQKLNALLTEVRAHNALYRHKLAGSPLQLTNLEELAQLPTTNKEELQPNPGGDPFAANRTYPIERYVRCHQTSGTRGRPLIVLDTAEDWTWWIEAWQYVLDAAHVTPADRALLAFSFGPFVGFWSAFDSLVARGVLVIPGGGLTSLARIEMIHHAKVTTLCCTPTYALRLAEVAAEHGIRLDNSTVEKIIVAGEPGGSVPTIRHRIETAWNARVVDHGGATEIGPWAFADATGRGLHINESQFLAEFISVDSGHPAKEGDLSHLILTTLGRAGAPVIRYRTGDIVRPVWNSRLENRFVFLDGGILARADDMLIIRGMNIYPTSVEHILHGFPEIVEYRMTARESGAMDELLIEVEDHLGDATRIAQELHLKLGLKVEVRCVPPFSLPRTEGKGRRFVDERTKRRVGGGEMGRGGV